MADMLVKLYALAAADPMTGQLAEKGIVVRRPMGYERQSLIEWVSKNFNPLWAQECEIAFGGQPIGCHIAVQAGIIIGFCCVNCTFKNFAGPIGVVPQQRGQGVGHILLHSALNDLKQQGYAYAVIGDAGEPDFFKKAAGAVEIAKSKPGPYPPKLRLIDVI